MPKDKNPARSPRAVRMDPTISDLHRKLAGYDKVNREQLERLLAYGRKLARLKGIIHTNLTPEQKLSEVQALLADWQ